MTSPDAATGSGTARPPAVDRSRVVGPGAVLEVCLRAAVILLALAVVLLGVVLATSSGASDAALGGQDAVTILALMYLLHLVALAVLGWPGGLLTAHLLRHETSERRHVAAFTLVGGALGAATLSVWGAAEAVAVWGVLGAAVAGGARAWTGHARRARAVRRATHPAALF